VKYNSFDKEKFCIAVEDCMSRLGIARKDLSDSLGLSSKTVGYYLDKSRNEIPKIPQLIGMQQLLETSITNLLFGVGPKHLDKQTAYKLNRIIELFSDPSKPAYFVLFSIISELEYRDVVMLKKHLELFIEGRDLIDY